MADKPKKRGRPPKAPVEMTGDELMERVFNKQVRKKLKKLAEENRPKEPKDQ